MKKLIIGLSILAAVISCGPSRYTNSQKVSQPTASDNWSAAQLYYRHTDTIQHAWNDSTLIFHHWKEMADSNYLFSVPNPDSVAKWKAYCEEESVYEGYKWLPERYHTMNQYVTIGDISMMCVEKGSCVRNKEFILWRLNQFRTDTLRPINLSDKFSVLQQTIDDLLDYQPFFTVEYNDQAGLVKGLQEFYDEILFDQVLKQTDEKVKRALIQEKKAWEEYHQALDSSMFVLIYDPDGYMGNTYSQTIHGALAEDAFIWNKALEDFAYPLSGTYVTEKHTTIPESKVVKEYQHFMNTLEEDEFLLPVPRRQEALKYEMSFWRKWMNSRQAVSSLLSGEAKSYYDNATNNVRRMKYIMLKNCYAGYGITSQQVIDLLVPFTASDEELQGLNFNEKWK